TKQRQLVLAFGRVALVHIADHAMRVPDVGDPGGLLPALRLEEEANRRRERNANLELAQRIRLVASAPAFDNQLAVGAVERVGVLALVNKQPVAVVLQQCRQDVLKDVSGQRLLCNHRVSRSQERVTVSVSDEHILARYFQQSRAMAVSGAPRALKSGK